jgi:isoleucyl-tRNA synthetase
VASFQSLYARANGWVPGSPDAGTPTALDRWALSEAHRVALEVDRALEEFDTARAGKALATYIDDLSNWYVRRSRRRFWEGDPAALATLHECLYVLTLLMAPFTPFITERVWGALFAGQPELPDSVHLAAWPSIDPQSGVLDPALADQVALVRRLVELGRAARADSKVKTRQPLAVAYIAAPGWDSLDPKLKVEVADELNVNALARLADANELIDVTLKPNFRALGKRFGPQTKQVADAILSSDPNALTLALRGTGTSTLLVGGRTVNIETDDVIVTETPRSGWAVASAGAETVALDLELTHELRLAGLLRDVVRVVQDARKNAGLDVTDRIELWWRVGGSPEPAEAIREHADQLAAEVLATGVHEGAPPESTAAFTAEDDDLGLRLWLRRA